MIAEDLDTFFDTDEFGETVTLGSVAVAGMFGEEPVEVDYVQTVKPVFTCKSSDAASVAYDATLVRGASTYKVKRIKQDETARLTTLVLELQ